MENVVLVVHLILALALIAIVLLQRSEGGGFGQSSTGGVMSGRAAATALSKFTWVLAGAFLATSIGLTIIAAKNSATGSVLDRISAQPAQSETPAEPTGGSLGTELLPPSVDGTSNSTSGDLVPTLE